MVAATITSRYKGGLAKEVILATIVDGYTVMSGLSKPFAAFATAQTDVDGEINCVISGKTITVNAAGFGGGGSSVAILVLGRL